MVSRGDTMGTFKKWPREVGQLICSQKPLISQYGALADRTGFVEIKDMMENVSKNFPSFPKAPSAQPILTEVREAASPHGSPTRYHIFILSLILVFTVILGVLTPSLTFATTMWLEGKP